MTKNGQCFFILSQPMELPVRHCGAPAGYTMKRDDDDNLVRKYRPFCPKHQARADELDREEEAAESALAVNPSLGEQSSQGSQGQGSSRKEDASSKPDTGQK